MALPEILIVFCVERPSKEGAPLGWGYRTMWRFYLSGEFEKFVEYCRNSDLPMFSVEHLLYLVFQHKRQLIINTSHLLKSVILMFTPFKLQDS